MACVNCDKIRSAILHGKMAEAAGLTVGALREKFGIAADPAEVAQEFSLTGAISPEAVNEAVEAGKSAAKAK